MSNSLPDRFKKLLKNEDPTAIQALPDYVEFEDVKNEDLNQALPYGTELEDLDGDNIDLDEVGRKNIKFKKLNTDRIKFPKPVNELYYSSFLLSFVTSIILGLALFISILSYQNYISLSEISDIYTTFSLLGSYYVYGYFGISLSIAGAISTVVWYILASPPAIRNEINITTGFFTALLIGAVFHLIAGIGGPITYLAILLAILLAIMVLILALLVGILISVVVIPYGLLKRDLNVVGAGISVWVVAGIVIFLDDTISTLELTTDTQIVSSIYVFAIAVIPLVPIVSINALIDRSELGEKEYLYNYLILYMKNTFEKELDVDNINTENNNLLSSKEPRSDIIDSINLIDDINHICENLNEVDELTERGDYVNADKKLAVLNDEISAINDKEMDGNQITDNTEYGREIEQKLQDIGKKFEEVKKCLEEKKKLKRLLDEDLDSIESKLNKANNHIRDSRFEEAKKILTKTESNLSSSSEMIKDSQYEFDDLSDLVSEYEQRESSLRSKLEEHIEHRQNLADQVDSIQSELGNTDTLIKNREPEQAQETLNTVASDIESAKETAAQYNFDDIQKELRQLNERYQDYLEEAEKLRLQNKVNILRTELGQINTFVENEEFEEAQETLNTIASDIESAKETASQYNFDDIQREFTQLSQRRQDYFEEAEELRLQNKVSILRTDLEQADIFIENEELEEAQETLNTIASDIESAKETASQYNFDDIQKELTQLSQRRQDCFEEAEELRREQQYEQFQKELETIRSDTEQIDSLVTNAEYQQANQLLSDIESHLESLKQEVSKQGFDELKIEVRNLEQELSNRRVREAKKQEIEEELDSIRSDLYKIDSLITDAGYQQAEELVDEIKSNISSLEQQVWQEGLDTLETKLRRLEKKCEDRLSKSHVLTQLREMDPYEFEEFVAKLWEKQGWDAQVTSGSTDRGVDIIATKEDAFEERRHLIQVKRHGENSRVGSEDIQRYASLYQRDEQVDNVFVVTSNQFTSEAEGVAKGRDVSTVNGNELYEMLTET